MTCSSCETGEACHRVVVDVHDGAVRGEYCWSCETEHFGEVLERGDWSGGSRCVLCDDHGGFALPLREIEYVETPDGEVRRDTYPVTPETPRICRNHLEEVLDVTLDGETEQLQLPEMTPVVHARLD